MQFSALVFQVWCCDLCLRAPELLASGICLFFHRSFWLSSIKRGCSYNTIMSCLHAALDPPHPAIIPPCRMKRLIPVTIIKIGHTSQVWPRVQNLCGPPLSGDPLKCIWNQCPVLLLMKHSFSLHVHLNFKFVNRFHSKKNTITAHFTHSLPSLPHTIAPFVYAAVTTCQQAVNIACKSL